MERAGGEAGAPTPPAQAAAGAGGGPAKGRSCKGCLFYSSVLRSGARGPVCVGITRALPQGYSRAPLQPPSTLLFVSGLGFLLIHPAAVYNALKLFSGLRTLRSCEWPVGYHFAATNRSPSLSQGKWEGQIRSSFMVSNCARKGLISGLVVHAILES